MTLITDTRLARTKICIDERCARRGTAQPWSAFYVARYNDDGTVGNVKPYCKVCANRRRREQKSKRGGRTPEQREAHKLYLRAYNTQKRQDPDYVEAERRRTADGRRRRGEAQGDYRPRPIVDTEGTRRLPIAPLRAWLQQQLAFIGSKALAAPVELAQVGMLTPLADLAQRLGVPEKRLYCWLHINDTFVTLDHVDQALCNWGDPLLLRELYPEIYEVEEAA